MRSRVLLSRIVFFLYLVAICFLLFATSDDLPNISSTMWGLPTDKVAHFLMFFPFPILAFMSSDKVSKKIWHCLLFAVVLFALGTAVAAITETIQGLLGYRSAELSDFKVDILAMGISSVLVMAVDLGCVLKHKR